MSPSKQAFLFRGTYYVDMRFMFYLHTLLCCLAILDLWFFAYFGISLAGQTADTTLGWAWVISSFYCLFRVPKEVWAKIYTLLNLILLGFSIMAMGLPFSSFLMFIFNFSGFSEVKNEDYSIREVQRTLLGTPNLELVKDHTFYEQVFGYQLSPFYAQDKKSNLEGCLKFSIEREEKQDAIRAILYYETDTIKVNFVKRD